MTGSVSATGALQGTNTNGGAAIVSIDAANLPRGMYRIDVYSQMTAIANANHASNVELRAGSTSLVTLITHIVAQNAPSYIPKQPLTVWRYLDGATPLSCNFIANMATSETQDWTATIVATQVPYGGTL